jgi:beta-glucosidase
LVGWLAADVQAGEAATVTVQCDARMWRRWDIHSSRWVEIDGGGELLIARGLGDVRLRVPAPATVRALTAADTVSR